MVLELFNYADTGQEESTAPELPVWRLTEEHWDEVRRYAAQPRYPEGACILAFGAATDALHIVLEGAIALSRQKLDPEDDREPDLLGPGAAFGITGFLDGEASALEATAASAASLLVLPRAGLEQLAAWRPLIAITLLHDVAAFASRRLRSAGIAI